MYDFITCVVMQKSSIQMKLLVKTCVVPFSTRLQCIKFTYNGGTYKLMRLLVR